MAHDATKVLLGSTQSNIKDVVNKAGTIAAGLLVRLKSDDTISIALADGLPLGISLGNSQSGISRTAIAIAGNRVPVKLASAFTPTIGAQVHMSDTTGEAAASGTGKTGLNAVYLTGVLTGITEAGAEVNVALIAMPGGL